MKKFIVGICLALVCIGFNSCAVYGVDEHYVGRPHYHTVYYRPTPPPPPSRYQSSRTYRNLGNIYSPSYNPSRKPQPKAKPAPRNNRTDKRR